MLLRLYRSLPQGNAICGQLYVDGKLFCDTLERADVAIPAGFYPMTLTVSPRFGEILPLIGNIVGRTGIRIHAGNFIRDTAGCILVGVASICGSIASPQPRLLSSRRTLNRLRDALLINYNNRGNKNYEPLYIDIVDADPYPLYDVPCPRDQCMHNNQKPNADSDDCNDTETNKRAA